MPPPLKPGWKSTEFWVTASYQVVAFLVLLGKLSASEQVQIDNAIHDTIIYLGMTISAAVLVFKYASDRLNLKWAHMDMMHESDGDDSQHGPPVEQPRKPVGGDGATTMMPKMAERRHEREWDRGGVMANVSRLPKCFLPFLAVLVLFALPCLSIAAEPSSFMPWRDGVNRHIDQHNANQQSQIAALQAQMLAQQQMAQTQMLAQQAQFQQAMLALMQQQKSNASAAPQIIVLAVPSPVGGTPLQNLGPQIAGIPRQDLSPQIQGAPRQDLSPQIQGAPRQDLQPQIQGQPQQNLGPQVGGAPKQELNTNPQVQPNQIAPAQPQTSPVQPATPINGKPIQQLPVSTPQPQRYSPTYVKR